ncbi:MAG: hypothetical protein ACOY0R_18480 [Chloroflexota bacterium]
MKITCWNCKKEYELDAAAVDAALKSMDASKLGFLDVPCPHCDKENRTKRADFEAAKLAFEKAAEEAAKKAAEEAALAAKKAAEPELKGLAARKAKEKERAALDKKKGHKG